MAEESTPETIATPPVARSKDEIALELMKFIAVTTGYAKGGGTTGYGSTKTARSPEDYADSLIQLFERCREVVGK